MSNTVEGYLEILDRKFGFLRSIEKNFQPVPQDTFVPAPMIKRFKLSEGVFIEGAGIKGDGKNRNLKLAEIEKINRIPAKEYSDIKSLQSQVSISPSERLKLAQRPDDIMGRALDMIVPIGKGQRGLIISPPKSGKTTILKHMAKSITANNPEAVVFVLLVDERPEEVTDFRRGLEHAHVLSSSADQSVNQHLRMTKMTLNTAIRSAEMGIDTVVFIDSLTRMSRAFNKETQSYSRTLTGGLGANAMEMPRRLFGAARNIADGGSLTIIATILIKTGSKMDDIIFQEFKGTGNMDLVLSRKCAEQRVWPAIDIVQSGTRKEHLLLDPAEFKEMTKLRRALYKHDEVTAMSAFIEYLSK
ncbi:Transcription termination factor Rho [Olavius algarvensis Delta 1 endosymbiont]|nr:Transcription termination factor Rho [Olavius algarvensis Delta 1 endosymbiont]